MSITTYEEDGKVLWQIYLNLRSRKNLRIRVQKRIRGIESEAKALSEEKKLLRELSEQIIKLESVGATWGEVIAKWQDYHKEYPDSKYLEATVDDNAARLRRYTRIWLHKPACELNRGDGREVLNLAQREGARTSLVRSIKHTINVVYKWGIEEKIIPGVQHSPVFGIEIKKEKEDRLPEILTKDQIRELLVVAKQHAHSWYPIWVMALLTGMRSGELYALRWDDIELISNDQFTKVSQLPREKRSFGMIRVTKTWNTRFKTSGPTKGGYWRTVPISGELYQFLRELKVKTGNSEHVLPQFREWRKGSQANVLRKFCLGTNLPSIKFHTLRACFATQLISDGIAATRVMKICGWKDLKTMQRYIRMAGVEEKGATEVLQFMPSDDAVMEHVASMYAFKGA